MLEAGINSGRDPSQSIKGHHAHTDSAPASHTKEQFRADNSPTGIFMGGGKNPENFTDSN